MAFLGPAHVSRVGEVTQRHQDLEGYIGPERREGPSRASGRGMREGIAIIARGRQEADPPRPVRLEEHERGRHHQPREDPDPEELRVERVEEQPGRERERPRAFPEEERHDREIEEEAAVRERDTHPGLGEERAENGEIRPVLEPAPDRLAAEPVAVELGDASEEVGDANLRAEQPERPGRSAIRPPPGPPKRVERERAVRGQENEDQGEEGDQVEVVEVDRRSSRNT